jgi:hypothetical protein
LDSGARIAVVIVKARDCCGHDFPVEFSGCDWGSYWLTTLP